MIQHDIECWTNIALSLLVLERTHDWFGSLATVDEKWILYSSVHRRTHLVVTTAEAEEMPKLDEQARK